MRKGRLRIAALLAGVAAPVYLVIQLLFGSDLDDAIVRAVIFFVVLFVVSLAIDWDRRAAPPRDANDTPPSE